MPLHMDIVPIQRLVVIVAHGEVTADDLANNVKELIAANVAHFAKIIDVSTSHWVLTKEQIDAIAETLRGDPHGDMRGPVAFIVRPEDEGFAHAFAGDHRRRSAGRGCSTACTSTALARGAAPGRRARNAPRWRGRRSQTSSSVTANRTFSLRPPLGMRFPSARHPGDRLGELLQAERLAQHRELLEARRWPRRHSRSPARSAGLGRRWRSSSASSMPFMPPGIDDVADDEVELLRLEHHQRLPRIGRRAAPCSRSPRAWPG